MIHKTLSWVIILLLVVGFSQAQNDTAITSTELKAIETGLNSSWLLICGFLVFFMQAGFAILEAGAVSKSDTRNILFKNLLDVCVTGLIWWGFGFAFAFGNGDHDASPFIGNRFFFSNKFPEEGGGMGYAFWFFEFAFAGTSATIVSGAIAERATFVIYILWSLVSTLWLYPVVAHWVWSGQGWLSATNTNNDGVLGIGMIDFAGCGPVHMVGGAGALIGAIVSGYRNKRSKVGKYKPRFEKVNHRWLVNDIPGKSEIFSSLGVLMLWFSWYGFNCGSTLHKIISTVNAELTTSRVAVTTTIAASAGGLTCVFLGRALSSAGKFNINDANNGILAGLVSITAGCSVVEPWGAFIIGIFGALFFKFGSFVLLRLRIDDPVEASPLHLGCGIWGLLSTGLFAQQEYMIEVYGRGDHYGLFMGGGGKQLGAQFIGVLAIGGWTLFWAAIFWFPAKFYDRKRINRLFFKEEDVTGGVDQKFISVALTRDLHNNLANLGADLATEGSMGEIKIEMEPPHGIMMRTASTLGDNREQSEIFKILNLNPAKKRAFMEFLESLPDEDEDRDREERMANFHSPRDNSGRGSRGYRQSTNLSNTNITNNTNNNTNNSSHSNITGGH